MRKASHDGVEFTSISSSLDADQKKIGLIKSTRNSLKRRVNNFSHESDDTIIEPLLKDKERIENQSAKYLLSKCKTEPANKKENDKISVSINQIKSKEIDMIGSNSINSHITEAITTQVQTTSNIFVGPPKTHILVDVEGQKTVGHTASPLIFTTAKIHADGKAKQMEPVNVTPLPISSTIATNVATKDSNNICPPNINANVTKLDKSTETPVMFAIAGLVNNLPVNKKEEFIKKVLKSTGMDPDVIINSSITNSSKFQEFEDTDSSESSELTIKTVIRMCPFGSSDTLGNEGLKEIDSIRPAEKEELMRKLTVLEAELDKRDSKKLLMKKGETSLPKLSDKSTLTDLTSIINIPSQNIMKNPNNQGNLNQLQTKFNICSANKSKPDSSSTSRKVNKNELESKDIEVNKLNNNIKHDLKRTENSDDEKSHVSAMHANLISGVTESFESIGVASKSGTESNKLKTDKDELKTKLVDKNTKYIATNIASTSATLNASEKVDNEINAFQNNLGRNKEDRKPSTSEAFQIEEKNTCSKSLPSKAISPSSNEVSSVKDFDASGINVKKGINDTSTTLQTSLQSVAEKTTTRSIDGSLSKTNDLPKVAKLLPSKSVTIGGGKETPKLIASKAVVVSDGKDLTKAPSTKVFTNTKSTTKTMNVTTIPKSSTTESSSSLSKSTANSAKSTVSSLNSKITPVKSSSSPSTSTTVSTSKNTVKTSIQNNKTRHEKS